jgi:hypothetical protein
VSRREDHTAAYLVDAIVAGLSVDTQGAGAVWDGMSSETSWIACEGLPIVEMTTHCR